MRNKFQEVENKDVLNLSADIEKREGISILKTGKALNSAMFSLLEKYSFRNITVRDICTEARISRATFYSWFADKYDFLKWWMVSIWPSNLVNKNDFYEVKEQKINQYITANKTIIKNLFFDADSWTLDVLFDVLHSSLRLTTDNTAEGVVNPKYIVMCNFCIGGMIQYILWQIKNDFPHIVTMMNEHLYEVIKLFQEHD